MKQLLLSTIFLFVYFTGFSQCPSGFVDLLSQSDIDQFATDFPDCTMLNGSLRIQGSDITTLTPLSNIVSTEGLDISNTEQLLSLEGLENLVSITGGQEFVISNNLALIDVDGLEGLQTVETFIFDISSNAALENIDGLSNMSFQSVEFTISNNESLVQVEGLAGFSQVNGAPIFNLSNNPQLVSINGLRNTNFILDGSNFGIFNNINLLSLEGLNNIGGTVTEIDISNNDNLQEIRNLQGITSTDSFSIINNASLTVLDAFSGLDPMAIDQLSIVNNPNLVSCDSQFLCLFLNTSFDPDFIMIDNNASGCNSIEEIQDICDNCPLDPVVLSSQSEVNDFLINFPDCTKLYGLTIEGNDITDLTPLSGITEIGGALRLINNDQLSSLNGLHNIESVFLGSLEIRDNPQLESLSGLESLKNVQGLELINNSMLTSLIGLNNLEKIDNQFTVINNAQLTVIDNLNSLQSAEALNLDSNLNLSSLEGLSSVSYKNLSVSNNANLNSLVGLEGGIDLYGMLYIAENNSLANLIGLTNIASVDELVIANNPSLQNLDGLVNLMTIHSSLEIDNNMLLTSLSGLEGITSTAGTSILLGIRNNENLTDISSLNGLNSDLIQNLSIRDNINLATCDETFVCEYLETTNPADIVNNALGCETVEQAIEFCNGCPNNSGILSSQADVDYYLNFPDCIVIEGSLVIEGADIADLSPLSNITEITGDVIIQNNEILVDLTGLEGIVSFSGEQLIIANNPILSSIAALSNLDNIEPNNLVVQIENNPALITLNGLENLNFSTVNELYITNNDSLIDLQGLENINFLFSLYIQGNDSLTSLLGLNNYNEGMDITISDNSSLTEVDLPGLSVIHFLSLTNNLQIENLDGLSALETVFVGLSLMNNDALVNIDGLNTIDVDSGIEDITITNNASLSICSSDFICAYTESDGSITISDNAAGCNSLEEIEQICRPCDFQIVLESQEAVNNFPIFYADCPDGILNGLLISGDDIVDLSPLSVLVEMQGGLLIQENPLLESLNGLQSLEGVDAISISDNLILTDISQLAQVSSSSISSLIIQNNDQLEVCSNLFVCNYLNGGGTSIISNNAVGCNSELEVLDSCDENLNTLSGTIGFDFNNDGCDVSDYNVNNILVSTTDGSTTITSLTNEDGSFELLVGEGTYTTSIVNNSLPNGFSGTPSSIETVFTGLGELASLAFCVEASEVINDVSVSLIPLQEPRPGVISQYIVQYENLGTQIMSGDISFEFDDEIMFYVDSEINPTTIEENSIVWSYIDLQPFESRTYLVSFELFIPPVVEGGEELNSVLQITPLDDDIDMRNNTLALKEIVVNSYDPNDKQVLQGNQILEEQVGDYLDYLVRFQNTGTADALKVVITDTLSENLNWNTFRVLSASDDYRVEITNDNEVAFIFEDINLPPEEQDEEGSNGYVAFEIRTNDNLELGDTIENTANIFFDFNPPIITNTVVTTVSDPLGLAEVKSEGLALYPNPASDIVTVSLRNPESYIQTEIINVNGQQLFSSTERQIDVSKLGDGFYFLKIKTINGSVIKKFIKD